MRRFGKWLFRIKWVTTSPTKVIPCRGCAGTGQINLITQEPVMAATGNTIAHIPCGGFGYIRVDAR